MGYYSTFYESIAVVLGDLGGMLQSFGFGVLLLVSVLGTLSVSFVVWWLKR